MNIPGRIFDLSKNAILTHQEAVSVIGHNIANVNTPGYSRQKLDIATNEPALTIKGLIGTGIKPGQIKRVYDKFLEQQIINENNNLGTLKTEKGYLEQTETILNEASGYGLGNSMNNFWNSWQDLTNNPSGYTERTILVSKSQNMASQFKKAYSELDKVRRDIDSTINGTLTDVNTLAEQIAVLNGKISQSETGGAQSANDYRDTRATKLKELSELIDISAFENPDGMISVSIGGGNPLIEKTFSRSLSTQYNVNSSSNDVVFTDIDGTVTNITSRINGGNLKGLINVRDNYIGDYMESINLMAQNLINKVNKAHGEGQGISIDQTAVPPAPYTNLSFFTGTSASNIDVNSDIVQDPNLIAAASLNSGNGNNENAIKIAALQHTNTMSATAPIDRNSINLTVTPSNSANVSFNINNPDAISKNVSGFGLAFTAPATWTINAAGLAAYPTATVIGDVNGFKIDMNGDSSTDITGFLSSSVASATISFKLNKQEASATYNEYYGVLNSNIGDNVANVSENYKHQSDMTEYLNNYRDSISGVSLDEEMINLIQFQHAYTASAKLISTADEMLMTMLNMI